MQRSAEVFLLDVWKAADYILRRTAGMSASDYLANEDIRFAVERNFTIIGEAAVNLRRYYPALGDKVEGLSAIVAFRNFVVHHYWSIDDDELWEIIQVDVLPLRDAVSLLLKQCEGLV